MLADRALDTPVVLAVPRGGVPVAVEVAKALGAQLDVVGVHEVASPSTRDIEVGAVTEEGPELVHRSAAKAVGIDEDELDELVAREQHELDQLLERIRTRRPAVELAGRTAVLVDDGLVAAKSVVAAHDQAMARGASMVLLAVPVCSRQVADALGDVEIVCCVDAGSFVQLEQQYEVLESLSDDDVLSLLQEVPSLRT